MRLARCGANCSDRVKHHFSTILDPPGPPPHRLGLRLPFSYIASTTRLTPSAVNDVAQLPLEASPRPQHPMMPVPRTAPTVSAAEPAGSESFESGVDVQRDASPPPSAEIRFPSRAKWNSISNPGVYDFVGIG